MNRNRAGAGPSLAESDPSPAGPQATSRAPVPGRLARAIPPVLAGVSCVYLAAILFVALSRITYPYELDWLEGAVFQSATRLVRGMPMYPPPSLSYAPLNYPPLYHMVSACAMLVLGESFAAMRAVSLVAALALFAMAFAFVRRLTGRAWAGWLGVGLFAACYRAGGAWLDVGRLDSLSIALMVAGTLVIGADRSQWRSPIVAAVLVVLSFLAKPTAIVMFLPVLVWAWLENRTRGIRLGGALAAGVLLAVIALDAWSAGGFSYYTFAVASRRPFDARLVWQFPLRDFLLPLAPALAVILAAAALPSTRGGSRPLGAFAALAAGTIAATWVLRTHIGCDLNVLIPVHLSVMVLAAVAYARLVAAAGASNAARRLAPVAAFALLLQLGLMAWDPWAQIPTAADRAEGDSLVEHLRRIQGRILVSSHPYLLVLAGKPEHVHVQSFMDVVKGSTGARERALLAEMRDSLAAHAWDVLLLDTRDWLADEARLAGYRPAGKLIRNPYSFWSMTGMRTRPEEAWIPAAPPDSTRR